MYRVTMACRNNQPPHLYMNFGRNRLRRRSLLPLFFFDQYSCIYMYAPRSRYFDSHLLMTGQIATLSETREASAVTTSQDGET
jgi:hypothetical protein